MNGWTTRISGGDFHIMKVGEIWAKNHEVFLVSPGAGAFWIGDLVSGIKLRPYDTPIEHKALRDISNGIEVGILYLVRTIVCSFQQNTYDVLLASSHYPYDMIPAIFHHLRHRSAPIVVYVHGLSIPEKKGMARYALSLFYNYLGLLLSKMFAKTMFVVNGKTRSVLVSMGCPRSKVILTSNGVDAPSKPAPNKRFDGIFLGRLTPEKGVLDLIDIWKKVCEGRPSSVLLIVGSGMLLNSIRKRIESSGLSANISVREWAWGDQKYELIMSSRVFVCPSYLESWGIAVAESIACRVPVIAYELPIYREVFQGVSEAGLITVPVGDKNCMASTITRLLDNPVSNGDLIANSRLVLNKYNWNTVARNELTVLRKAVSRDDSTVSADQVNDLGLVKQHAIDWAD
jgi:glycosyltransferase involved in cell wall biosynthesis